MCVAQVKVNDTEANLRKDNIWRLHSKSIRTVQTCSTYLERMKTQSMIDSEKAQHALWLLCDWDTYVGTLMLVEVLPCLAQQLVSSHV